MCGVGSGGFGLPGEQLLARAFTLSTIGRVSKGELPNGQHDAGESSTDGRDPQPQGCHAIHGMLH